MAGERQQAAQDGGSLHLRGADVFGFMYGRRHWRVDGALLATFACAAAVNLYVAISGPPEVSAERAARWASAAWRSPLLPWSVCFALVAGRRYIVRLWRHRVPVAVVCALTLNLLVASEGVGVVPASVVALVQQSQFAYPGLLLAIAAAVASSVVIQRDQHDRGPVEKIRAASRGSVARALWKQRVAVAVLLSTWLALQVWLNGVTAALVGVSPAQGTFGVDLFVLYGVLAALKRLTSQTAAAAAMGALLFCPLALLRSDSRLADELATFAYLSLCLAVIQGMWELMRRRDPAPVADARALRSERTWPQ